MAVIGITMGCPAGIGPEIIIRYLNGRKIPDRIEPVVLGDPGILRKCSEQLHLPVTFSEWSPGSPTVPGTVAVMALSELAADEHAWGKPNRATANAMVRYIETAVELAGRGLIDAMTTCPIAKDSLNEAGYAYPGHTEMLVDLTGAGRYTMMMAGASLKVTLATIHTSIADVPSRLSADGIFELIMLTSQALRTDFGLASPRIGVAGLNPHCGEGGLFGREEEHHIVPAVRKARQAGVNASGPFPPDTVFYKAAQGGFDCVVCMYHDQGLIPFKLLHFKDGVNVTLGLPIVRTSVDHGTAYDIAGQGKADPDSLEAAVTMACDIAANRSRASTGAHDVL